MELFTLHIHFRGDSVKRIKQLILWLLAAMCCTALCGCSQFQNQMAKTTSKMAKLENFHVETEIRMDTLMTVGRQKLHGNAVVSGGMNVQTDPLLVKTDMLLDALGSEFPLQFYISKDYATIELYDYSADRPIESGTVSLVTAKKPKTTQALKLLIRCGDFFEDPVKDEVNGETVRRYDGLLPDEYIEDALVLLNLKEADEAEAGTEEVRMTAEEKLEELRRKAAAGEPEEEPSVSGLPAAIWVNEENMIVQVRVDISSFIQGIMDDLLALVDDNYDLDGLILGIEIQTMEATLTLSDFDSLEIMKIPE